MKIINAKQAYANPHFSILVLLAFLLSFVCTAQKVQKNPFMEMADKKYADYAQELGDEFLRLIILYDTLEFQKFVGQIEEVATKTGSREWKLQADYYELSLIKMRNHYARDKLSHEELLGLMLELLKKAQKVNVPQIELRVRYDIIESYFMALENYELAFEYCRIQDERLQAVSSDDYPGKAECYVQIANIHYWFKDYSKAIFYYNKILEEKDNVRNYFAKQHARNGLGLSYAAKNELDSSDIYFRAMIQTQPLSPENEAQHELWNGIAEGNIGDNMLQRHEYNQAISLLKSSIEKVLKHSDYSYAAGRAVDLANIYLKKDNLAEAKRYIDLATAYNNKSQAPRNIHLFYEVLSKYFAATGNNKMSIMYMDSTLESIKQMEEQFNALLLLRLEQKESAKQQQQFVQEKAMRQQAQFRILMLSIGFIIIFSLLGLVLFFYRRKRAAYRELVRKSLQWAQVQPETANAIQPTVQTDENEATEQGQEVQNAPPDETDFEIMEAIERRMTDEKIYRDGSLSVDSMAQLLGFKRYYISGAINRCSKKNFNTFINEYRIKEAIRLLSEKNARQFSMDGIALDAGFNDRRNFLRVFKKMTGLTPTEFVKVIASDT